MAYNYDVIGVRLRSLRKEWGYSLERVAEACDVQQYQTVSKWESANTIPSMKQLLKLCNLYGCDIGYLLGEHDCKTRKATDIQEETGLSEDAIEILKKLSINSPSTVAALSKIITFNSADILELLKDYLQFNFNQDVDTGTAIIKGQALDNMYLLEINAELKAMKEKGVK